VRPALKGVAVGVEVLCRLSLVVPKAVHKAGFHPTAVFGAMGAAAGVAAALRLDQKQTGDALGIAGSMASGIIEYLAEGAWTKRMAMPAGPRSPACAPR
jgi:2-methylcitrate dehydratase PrpD